MRIAVRFVTADQSLAYEVCIECVVGIRDTRTCANNPEIMSRFCISIDAVVMLALLFVDSVAMPVELLTVSLIPNVLNEQLLMEVFWRSNTAQALVVVPELSVKSRSGS